MVRLLIALVALLASGCFMRSTRIDPVPQKEEIIHVSTAYAYQPEKVEQPPFDKRGARDALARIDVRSCGATHDGHAKVTFAADGTVSAVAVDWPNDLSPATRECVRQAFTKARVVAFDGAPVTLGTSWRAR